MANSDFEEDVFEVLELEVKDYIKRLLMLSGFDDLTKLECIDEKKLSEIEQHIRKRFGGSSLLSDRRELRKYFGNSVISTDEIKIFQFNLGARETILTDIPRAIRKYKKLPPQPKTPVKREESSSFKDTASYSYEEIEMPPPNFKIKRESLPGGGSNGKNKRKKSDQEYNEITFEELVEEKAEIFKKTCNNYLKSHFPDCYSPVEEVAVEVGADFQLQSASVVCPYCDPGKNFIKCSIDRNRRVYRVTVGNFIRHLYSRHVEKNVVTDNSTCNEDTKPFRSASKSKKIKADEDFYEKEEGEIDLDDSTMLEVNVLEHEEEVEPGQVELEEQAESQEQNVPEEQHELETATEN